MSGYNVSCHKFIQFALFNLEKHLHQYSVLEPSYEVL